ncbi:MAG: VWA domain-containing protein [Rhizobiaceae bacterium]|nr:VWA domain-containing protein [Rhizobiaceae bacterium]
MTCGLSSLKDVLRDTSGNFAMVTAIIAPVMLAAGGISLDVANTLSLKERMQIAADGTNLTVAKRLSSGKLSMSDAEDFARDYLSSQLEAFNDRYNSLSYDITAYIEEAVDENITTWNLVLNVEASLQSSSLLSFITDELLTISINSGSTTSNEDLQGAFSMSIVIDVSGSMAWPTDEAVDMQDILDESRGNAGRVSASIYEAHEIYGLSEDQIKYILQNYAVKDCWKMEDSYDLRIAFLQDIGEPTSTDADLAYNYCYHPAYAAKKADADTIIANWDAVFSNIDASKIRLLKDAASNMLDQMAAADPEEQYVRTGSVTYHSEMDDQTDLAWGISDTMNFINDLKANGGTSSTDAMDWSYDKLKLSDGTEANEHAQKNGQIPDRFIVFMTDGENNYSADDTSTKAICDQAKNDGIIIYTVAFAAPEGGQELLSYCATSPEHYFEPETASQLTEAFEYIGRKTTNTPTRLTM